MEEEPLTWMKSETSWWDSLDWQELRKTTILLLFVFLISGDKNIILYNFAGKLSYFRDAVDEEGDGDISKDEFVKNAMKSKFIFNMLKE